VQKLRQGRIHGLKSGGRIMASARNEAPKEARRLDGEAPRGVGRGAPYTLSRSMGMELCSSTFLDL